MSRSDLLGALFAISTAILAVSSARAGEIQPFTFEAFQAAQAAGQPVLIDVHAFWCPICWQQSPTIDAISTDPAFAKLVIFKIDYDKQRAEKHALGVRQQSTLIAFAGKAETGRRTGVTDPDDIRKLAESALR